MRVDFGKLKRVVDSPNSKSDMATNSSDCLAEFTALISNFAGIAHTFSQEQLASLIISMQNWMLRREFTTCKSNVNIGDIFYTDLGNCYKPELAFPHPVVILEDVSNMVLVAPVSTSSEIVNNAFHPVDNPAGKKEYRKAGKTDGFEHDCAIILSNIRTISKGRLLEKKGQLNDISNPTSLFYEIKNKGFELCFPKQFIKFRNLSENKDIYENTLELVGNSLTDIKVVLDETKESMDKDKILSLIQKIETIEKSVQDNIKSLR
jgi:mRNA-degrading endonuclease toxin of MazEF toxin-antitoxin module